jgi:MoxR-vWA-beta-propeller ternary system domain bpX2/FtsH ternary system domain X7
MSSQWVIRILLTDAESLAPLRLTRGIEVAEKEAFVWIRGASGDERFERLVRALPAVARYEITGGNRLRNLESRIPAETLPALNWQSVNTWLRVKMPLTPALSSDGEREKNSHSLHVRNDERDEVSPLAAGPGLPAVSIRIVRSAEERSVALLVTSLDEWREFALNAPEIRLRQLRFAVDEAVNVVIRGKPLPPLPGRQFVLHGNIAVQAGFTWEPAVSADVLSRRLGLATDALALFHDDGTFSRIEAEQFVPATRSAVRETAEGFVTR